MKIPTAKPTAAVISAFSKARRFCSGRRKGPSGARRAASTPRLIS